MLSAGRPLEGLRVLVVEDQYLIAEGLRRTVLDLGGVVAGPFSSARSALEYLDAQSVDFALLDIELGDGPDGYGVAEALERCGTPFIFATGYDHAMLPVMHQDAPHLIKPITADALADCVRALFVEGSAA
jgi:DNA-binding LytR/AlgR family response regulator